MKQFLKQTISSTIGTFLGLGIFLVLGAGGILLTVAILANQQQVSIKDKSILVFDLSDIVQDAHSSKSIAQTITSRNDRQTLALQQVLEAINRAAQDNKIKAIFLDGRNSKNTNGYSNLSEIRIALEKFKKQGKKVIAYANNWDEKSYYLASTADQVIVNPLGTLEINGLVSEPLFFAGALKKYGIGVQIIRVGSFKSAVEPYIRSNLSSQNRQQLQELLGNIWDNFITSVSQSRQMDIAHLKSISNNIGILNAQQAKQEKLVDSIAYYDQVVTELKKISNTNEKSYSPIDLSDYLATNKTNNNLRKGNKIALVYAEGTITDGQGSADEVGGEKFSKELRNIRNDDDVKAVVLRINSPGGSATASDIILREIQLLGQKKPVVISMGNVAASGGYWIATGGQYIFANNDTITGSIGVFGMLFNLQKLANNNGLTWDVVKTGKLADISSSSRPKTEKEIDLYQRDVNRIYDLFIDKVSSARHLNVNRVKSIAQGRVWSGYQAQKIGLVDQIGGLEAAIQYAAKLAKIDANWKIEEHPQENSWRSILLDQFSKTQDAISNEDLLIEQWNNFKKQLNFINKLNDPNGVYLLFPYELNIN
jgi:protease-4